MIVDVRDRPESTRRSRGVAAAAILLGVIGFSTSSATYVDADEPPRSKRACFLIPATDSQPIDAHLVTMFRIRDGALEVLHRVECTDHTVGFAWIPGDII